MINQLEKELKELKQQLQVSAQFDDLISEEEVSKKFGVTMWTIRNMRRKGVIKKWYSMNGKNIMVSKSELLTLLKNPA